MPLLLSLYSMWEVNNVASVKLAAQKYGGYRQLIICDNELDSGFKHMKKIGNYFGDPTDSYLVDPATGWIQEIQAQSHFYTK
jgi:hypothetical protein